MPKLTADKLIQVIEGRLIQGKPETSFRGIMAKCAKVRRGFLYFDVKGGSGGNENILTAIENGATGIVISKHKKVLPFEDPNIVVIAVPKVWEAFWRVIEYYRDIYEIPVVGVTGTSGKTTTKEMISSIFKRRWKVLKTVANMNLPDFVPSHIMRMGWGYQAAVFEIGMNRPNHISKQSRVIKPKIGIITHIGPGHVEHLGSFENVIKEKAGIMQGIPDDGYLVLNADDPVTPRIDISQYKGNIIYYGIKNKADYTAGDIVVKEKGTSFKARFDGKEHQFFIPTFGEHNVYNALAAITAARLYNFDPDMIRKGLANYRKPKMRLQMVKGVRNSLLINDSYNANPNSMIAGLEVLSLLSKGKTGIAVLGNMLEQGKYTVENHRLVGEKAASLGIDWLITVGRLAKEIANGAAHNPGQIKTWSFLLKDQAIAFLKKNLPDNSVILVKGSRGSYMERVVRFLRPPGTSAKKTV